MEEMDRLANEPRSVVISCNLNLNLDYLVERIWEELKLLRIYTKKRGEHPDLTDPIIVRRGATIEHVVRNQPLIPVSWRAPCAGGQVCLVRTRTLTAAPWSTASRASSHLHKKWV